MAEMSNVLSVGAEPELVSLRDAVLKSGGFTVFSTWEADEAYVRIQPASFGLMLLCYSLEDIVRQRLAGRFRDCCPNGRIVLISNRRIESSRVYADVVFDALEGAEALIDTVRTELAHRQMDRMKID
jgi:DNA-binding response OmpR family regulator